MSAFSDYRASLSALLAKKDPSRVKKKRLGSIVFVLEDEAKMPHRITIRVGEKVEVVDGRHELPGLPTAFVFSSLADWIAFFDKAEAARIHSIDFYGEVALLETLAELSTQRLSPLALRAGKGI